MLKFILIVLLAFILTTTRIPSTVGQIPLLTTQTENKSVQTPWWDANKAWRCGQLVCSKAYLYEGDALTVALSAGIAQDEAVSALEVEKRAKLIEETVSSIFQQVIDSRKTQKTEEQDSVSLAFPQTPNTTSKIDWKYLLLEKDKALHPLTPRIEVGIKNNQTVVYVPVQPELDLSQQAIVTVTEADSLADGTPISELAQDWQGLIRKSLSESLWGDELDRKYLLGRPLAVVALALGMLGSIWGIRWVKRLLKAPERRYSRQLQELQQSLTVNPELRCSKHEAKAKSNAESTEIETSPALFDQSPTTSNTRLAQAEQIVQSQVPQLKSEGIISHFLETVAQVQQAVCAELAHFFHKQWHPTEAQQAQQATSIHLPTLLQNLPRLSLQWQMMLKQQRNLIHFWLRLLFWGQIFILLWGVGLMAEVYPVTRSYASFFLGHAFWLPLLWMLLSLAEKITNFSINHYLNQWAMEAQCVNPASQRYTLRVSTYSPALKGASAFIFSALGVYLTVQSFGINSQVLASAGIVAALVAFLSRNLLEDVLNGALILWTDRYVIGDVIKVGETVGLVEEMNLYTTQVRTLDGRLLAIPSGKIGIVENMTKEWSRADFQIEIAYNADVKLALEVIQQVAQQMQSEFQWQDKILESASVLGIEHVSHAGVRIRVLMKTQAMEKWTVERELRLRVKQAFDEAYIAIGVPQQIWHQNDSTSRIANGKDNLQDQEEKNS